MTIIRAPLVEPIEGRTASDTTDSLMLNAYQEQSPDGKVYAVKRAGLGVLAESAAIGQGLHKRESSYTVVGNVLVNISTPAIYLLAVNNEPYQFLDTPTAAGQAGFLLKSVGKLYYFEE